MNVVKRSVFKGVTTEGHSRYVILALVGDVPAGCRCKGLERGGIGCGGCGSDG